jgi:hypothetical protein
MFSPTKDKYLAAVQPNGMAGQRWYLYTSNGLLLWSGETPVYLRTGKVLSPRVREAAVLTNEILGQLANPSFHMQGWLSVEIQCENAPRPASAILDRWDAGWRWVSAPSCP